LTGYHPATLRRQRRGEKWILKSSGRDVDNGHLLFRRDLRF
jgi:hypothetical protein